MINIIIFWIGFMLGWTVHFLVERLELRISHNGKKH